MVILRCVSPLWDFSCKGWTGIGMDGCPGGVKYRAPCGANNTFQLHCLSDYLTSVDYPPQVLRISNLVHQRWI